MDADTFLVASLSQRLHVGADDIANTTNPCVAVNFVNCRLLLSEGILEGFDCNIKPYFVTELETVCDGLRYGINADWNALNLVVLNSLGQRRSRESDNSQRKRANSRTSCSLWERNPNRRWTLGRNLVKGQRLATSA